MKSDTRFYRITFKSGPDWTEKTEIYRFKNEFEVGFFVDGMFQGGAREINFMEINLKTLIEKLHPTRFSAMSGMMAAFVACVLDQEWTSPRLAELVVTSDGFVMGRREGDIGHNEFLGSKADFDQNWSRLLDAADLTNEERKHAETLYRQTMRQL